MKDHDTSCKYHKYTQPKACWRNAVFVLKYKLKMGQYVEGWVVFDDMSIPIEHGWIELDGMIIDPTLPEQTGKYFAGVRYDLNELADVKTDELPLVWNSGGWGGFNNGNYKSAYDRALSYAYCG